MTMPMKGLCTAEMPRVRDKGSDAAARLMPNSRVMGRKRTAKPMK